MEDRDLESTGGDLRLPPSTEEVVTGPGAGGRLTSRASLLISPGAQVSCKLL